MSQDNADGILPPERQRELILRYRDQGDAAAKTELMAGLPDRLRQSVEQIFHAEPVDVRVRIMSVASQMLEPLVDHIGLAAIHKSDGVDLVAETLDPVELEDELGRDTVGKAALAALEAQAGGSSDDEITRETAQDRTRIVGRISDLLLPVVRTHHLRGTFGRDFVQSDVDRVSELALRTVSRISEIVRTLPDRVILEESDEIEDRVLTDAALRSSIGFDPTEGFRATKQDAERVAEKAAAAREDAKRLAKERVRPSRKRTSSTPTRRSTPPPQRRTTLPPIAPKPKEPSVLDTMTRAEEEQLLVTLRDNSTLWARGNAFSDPEQRDQFWDPVSEALESTDAHVLRQMLALVRADRIRVERGLATEIERILKAKS